MCENGLWHNIGTQNYPDDFHVQDILRTVYILLISMWATSVYSVL